MKKMFLLTGAALAISGLILVAQQQESRAPRASQVLIGGEGESTPSRVESTLGDFATVADSTLSNTKQDEAEALVTVASQPSFEGAPWQVGVAAYESGDFVLAAEALEWAVREREDSAYRHYLLGLCYRRLTRPADAALEFSRSLELNAAQPRALAHLARTQLELGEAALARESVTRGIELDPHHADLFSVLGRIELAEAQLEPAAVAFARATELDPQHGWAWNNLGYVRLLQGRFGAALAPLQSAVATSKPAPEFFNNLALVLEQTGDLDGALAGFATAAERGHGPAAASLLRLEELVAARSGQAEPTLAESQ